VFLAKSVESYEKKRVEMLHSQERVRKCMKVKGGEKFKSVKRSDKEGAEERVPPPPYWDGKSAQ
jgi:hypothetical protein